MSRRDDSMRTEDAFRMLLDKCQHLSNEAYDARREKETMRRDCWQSGEKIARELEETRRALRDHRKAMKAAKIRKLPTAPKHFADWDKDDDIPF